MSTQTVGKEVERPEQGANFSEKRELAVLHDQRFRELEKQRIACWSEQAELATLIHDNEEWRDLGFSGFNDWLESAAPKARSTMYGYISLLAELGDVPQKDLREMEPGPARVLSKLPKNLRSQRRIVEKAKQGTKVFVDHIQQHHPELHIETIEPESFAFTRTQRITVDGGIALAQAMLDLNSREAAVEAVFADYISENREAFEKLRKEGKV